MLPLNTRWMVRRDVPAIIAIDTAAHLPAWSADDFDRTLRQRSVVGMVCERGDDILGFMIYSLHPSHLTVLNFGVDPAARRQGVGRALAEKLKCKLISHRRTRLICDIWEGDTPSHLFAAALGFRAVSVHGDSYRFEWRPTVEEWEPFGGAPVSRIGEVS